MTFLYTAWGWLEAGSMLSTPLILCSLCNGSRGLSFWFIEGKFTAMLGGMSTDATDILLENVKPGQMARAYW